MRLLQHSALWKAIGLAVVVVALFYLPYHSATLLRDSQVAGCLRGIKDRRSNVKGWTAAVRARRLAAAQTTGSERRYNLQAARTYQSIVVDQTTRIPPALHCQKVVPPASPWPF